MSVLNEAERKFGTVRSSAFFAVQTSPSVVPKFLQVGDVVESAFRGCYVPWIVREVNPFDVEGLPGRYTRSRQNVVASHPGRGAVRFTWCGDNGLTRYGVAGTVGRSTKFFFAYRPEPTEQAGAPESPQPEVLPGDVWRYKGRAEYRVLFVTNTRSQSDKRPLDVVYETLRDPAAKWSQPLSDWHRFFTLQSRKT